MTTTIKNPRATKKFKGLLAVLDGNEPAAITAWNRVNPDNQIAVEAAPTVSAEVKTLMEAGFSQEEAEAAIASAKSAPVAATAPLTSQEQAEALVAKAGLIHVRGRVYATPATIEAQVRVLKSGTPELVRNAGQHRTKAVIIYRMDDMTVAVQNLGEQN